MDIWSEKLKVILAQLALLDEIVSVEEMVDNENASGQEGNENDDDSIRSDEVSSLFADPKLAKCFPARRIRQRTR